MKKKDLKFLENWSAAQQPLKAKFNEIKEAGEALEEIQKANIIGETVEALEGCFNLLGQLEKLNDSIERLQKIKDELNKR